MQEELQISFRFFLRAVLDSIILILGMKNEIFVPQNRSCRLVSRRGWTKVRLMRAANQLWRCKKRSN